MHIQRLYKYLIFTMYFCLLFSTNTFATILYYKSNGEIHTINKRFPINKDLIFSSADQGVISRSVEKVKMWLQSQRELPFFINETSLHSINFDSIQNFNNNSYALRFTFDIDIPKMISLLPKATLFSKNILVRIKNGEIESIATGIEHNYGAIIKQKLKNVMNLLGGELDKLKVFNLSTFESFFSNLQLRHDLYKKFIFNFILKNRKSFDSFSETNHSHFTFLHLSRQLWDFSKTIKSKMESCHKDCLKKMIEDESHILDYNNDLKVHIEKWIRQEVGTINFIKHFFNEYINKKMIQIHLDSNNQLHLILELIEDFDFLKFDLEIGENGVKFTLIPQETHLNDLKLIDSKNITSMSGSGGANSEVTMVKSSDLNLFLEKQKLNQLNSTKDIISFILLYNQNYFKDQFQYERDESTKPLVVFHGIMSPLWRAESAAWAFSPFSRFFIGTGGEKFSNLDQQPDIISHEFFHSVEEKLSSLYFKNESGALKEHGGDIIGMIVSDFINDRFMEPPRFEFGCGILKENEFEKLNKSRQFLTPMERNQVCLRNFLDPAQSYYEQALSKSSIETKYGFDYQKTCEGTSENDFCGVHYQVAIPNRILSRFMLLLKEQNAILTWEDIKKVTAKIIFNTFAGRLSKDVSFISYGQHLKLECLDQILELNKSKTDVSVESCHYLENQFKAF